ncbi:hypothetical protein BH18ACT2_BH18ACT2_04260 [soil metagenome]
MTAADELERLFQEVRRSPFLAGHADRHDHFADLPIIGKAELRALIERNFDLRREQSGVYLLRTGGTLSEALLVPIGIDENRFQRQAMADHLRAAGVFTPTTVAVNLFNYKHLYRSASIFDDLLERCDATSIGLGAITPDEFVVNFCRLLGPDTAVGTPSRLYQLAAHVGQHGVELPIPHVVFGGEVMSTDYLDELRRALGVERVHGVYASVENGSWGWCDFDRDGARYRVVEEIVHVEIEDPDANGFGNIVVTNTIKRRFPVLRYRNGDRGRLVHVNGRLFVELEGRGGYTFRIDHRSMSERDFAPVVADATAFQIQLSLNAERRTRVDVLVVPAGEPVPGELDRRRQALARVLNGGPVDRDVRFVTTRELMTSATTNKTPLVVDHRQNPRM